MDQGPSNQPTLPAGVVTGQRYDALVSACKAGGYALPAVNVTGTNTINAVLEEGRGWELISTSTAGEGIYGHLFIFFAADRAKAVGGLEHAGQRRHGVVGELFARGVTVGVALDL